MVLGAVSFALALLGCTLRVARLWSVDDGRGRVDAHAVILTHGTLVWETNQYSSKGSPPTAPILNWQFEPGLSATTYAQQRIAFPMNPFGVVTTRTVAFSAPLALVGVACLLLALPWLPRRPGFCDCGHDLTGLRSDRCPECGKPLTDGGS